jgi:hypothetical protein
MKENENSLNYAVIARAQRIGNKLQNDIAYSIGTCK